ncbi:MAG TPA: hypothetical protein VII06_22675 [Chloroflexota bacterium]|jgi:hypothetical protein
MAREIDVDVTNAPELLRLAEEVQATKTPRVLSRDHEPLAAVVPIARRRRNASPSEADLAAALASAGAWKGLVDTEALKREIKEARGSNRPPVEL